MAFTLSNTEVYMYIDIGIPIILDNKAFIKYYILDL